MGLRMMRRIPYSEITKAWRDAPILWLVLLLIKEGAPLKIKRDNKWNIGELKENEIEFTGTIIRQDDIETGDMIFYWGLPAIIKRMIGEGK